MSIYLGGESTLSIYLKEVRLDTNIQILISNIQSIHKVFKSFCTNYVFYEMEKNS